MRTRIARFLKGESGATAIEYGLIAGGIALVCITAINLLGTTVLVQFFENIAAVVDARM